MTILYHYCSPSTFASIISRQSIWLSSLSLSNDSMEGKLVSKTFEHFMEKDQIDYEIRSKMRRAMIFAEDIFDGLGFCLSKQPDLLSQWRGYASDGQGFAIGFSQAYLEALCATQMPTGQLSLNKVLYETVEHETTLRPLYEVMLPYAQSSSTPLSMTLGEFFNLEIAQQKSEAKIKAEEQLLTSSAKSSPNMFQLKSKAFAEEQEWRLLSLLAKYPENKGTLLFRALENRLIPYREFELKYLNIDRICKVIVGPKNTTPKFVIERILDQYGFKNVDIELSSATYR